MANFCAAKPGLPPGNEEYGRDVQTQPYWDWTLQCSRAAKISGEYVGVTPGATSNAPPKVTAGKDTF